MRPRNPEKIEALLSQAAELRAAGQTWETVAAAVGRSAETVRRWPKQHPKLWLRCLRDAETQLLRDATAESVHTLRKQLRSEDEKASRDAAEKLIRSRVALDKKVATAKKPKAKTSEFQRVAAYLETLSDADIGQLIDDFLADVAARGAAAREPNAQPSQAIGE